MLILKKKKKNTKSQLNISIKKLKQNCIYYKQWSIVNLSIDVSLRALCRAPYEGHPHGCPNWGNRKTCPPKAPLIWNIINLSNPVYCIYNSFNLMEHVEKLREKHPLWSYRKLACCLYWQGKARKQLREIVDLFLNENPGYKVIYTPEACGVNVTATMESIGINLEWPPDKTTYQVAIAGKPLEYP